MGQAGGGCLVQPGKPSFEGCTHTLITLLNCGSSHCDSIDLWHLAIASLNSSCNHHAKTLDALCRASLNVGASDYLRRKALQTNPVLFVQLATAPTALPRSSLLPVLFHLAWSTRFGKQHSARPRRFNRRFSSNLLQLAPKAAASAAASAAACLLWSGVVA